MTCPKCNGTGFYHDGRHPKPCETCCTHSLGWWQLPSGLWACVRGCGETRKEKPNADT